MKLVPFNAISFVGWVERSETHQSCQQSRDVMGIAALHPSYGLCESAQCDRARQNATTCSSAVFIGEAGNSASASTAIAP